MHVLQIANWEEILHENAYFIYVGIQFIVLTVFYGEFEKIQKKEKKKFDLLEWAFEVQIFRNSPVHDLNFHGR